MEEQKIEQVKEHFKNAKIVECVQDKCDYHIDVDSIHECFDNFWCTDNKGRLDVLLYDSKLKQYASIIEYKQDVKEIEVVAEEIEPKHYDILISNKNNESIKCDFFDIGNALNLSREQFTAFRYLRVKGDVNKQINDTQKAIKCLERYLDKINKNNE